MTIPFSKNGFQTLPLSPERRSSKRMILMLLAGIATMFLFVTFLATIAPLRASLFLLTNNTAPPTTGIFFSQEYQAQPNERGSVVLVAAESFNAFEGMEFTFAVDPMQADIVRVRRTAATQPYDISLTFPAPGVAKIALVGAPKNIVAGTHLLEVELQLARSTVLRVGQRIDVRILLPKVHGETHRLITASHDGRITIVTAQEALTPPAQPSILDIAPGIFPLVRGDPLVIRGQSFPSNPRVFLGNHVLPVLSASQTEIIATIPEETEPGIFHVMVESLLAEERVVVFGAPAIAGNVDILDELLFLDPHPIRYTPTENNASTVLWIPVMNPLGVDDPLAGTIDLSSLDGDPNVSFEGTGTPAIGPGGTRINWFRVPETGTMSLPDDLETNRSYPLEIRVENRAGSIDTATAMVELKAQIPTGDAPVIGAIETVPTELGAGGNVTLYADISDSDGIASLSLVTLRLTSIGLGIVTMEPAFSSPGGVTLTTLPYSAEWTVPASVEPGTYTLEIQAIDSAGNETVRSFPLVLGETGGATNGNTPEFMGRFETKPSPIGLGGTATFFVAVRDAEGSDTIQQVLVDLVDVGGKELELNAVTKPISGSTEPVLFTGEFTVASTLAPGSYPLVVRAFDEDGNVIKKTLNLLISSTAVQTSVPVILQAAPIPGQVSANDDMPVVFRAEIEDSDGLEDIVVVRIDLGPIRLPVTPLTLQTDVSPKEGKRGFFLSDEMTVPKTVLAGSYNLRLEAEDQQGHLVQKVVLLTVGAAPAGNAPLIRESRFVPETAHPGGSVRLYVDLEDVNGATGDMVTVTADFTEVEREFEELDDLLNFPSGTLVTRTTYASPTITLPDDLSVGTYDIPLTVADNTGNIVRTIARLRVEKNTEQGVNIPSLDASRTLQVPRVLANDDSSKGELSVLVSDLDDDVVTVIAKLGAVASAKSASVQEDENDFALLCDTSSAIACMERGAIESTGQRWFVLKGITVPPTTQRSKDPYIIDLTIVDRGGHLVDASVPLLIGGPETEVGLTAEPTFNLVVPVSATQLELVLGSPLDTRTTDQNGSQFILHPSLDAATSVTVRRVAWDTTGRYIYLQSDPLTPGETYILTVPSSATSTIVPLTDIYGSRFMPDRGGKITFTFQTPQGRAPAIDQVIVRDAEHLDIRFAEPVLPSSVHPDLLATHVSLSSMLSGETFAVRGGTPLEGGRVLRLTVDPLHEGERLRLRMDGVLAPGLVEAPTLEKTFIVLFPRDSVGGNGILPTADLNHDGRVDFADFTLFSVVYNTEYDRANLEGLSSNEAAPKESAPKEREKPSFGEPSAMPTNDGLDLVIPF